MIDATNFSNMKIIFVLLTKLIIINIQVYIVKVLKLGLKKVFMKVIYIFKNYRNNFLVDALAKVRIRASLEAQDLL